jgi:uncharacterized membrane protein HdeD (DUF308 family)
VCEMTDMRTHSRRVWPLFLADAVLAAVGLFALRGAASGVVLLVALLAIIGTAISALRGEDVNDGACGIGGGTSF